ncbi:MAG: ABC transporter permease subunit [Oscillospiraceae bacterium]|mgnify:CR=1 FL=1|jgi:NitT/TauT family transport system permease protein|nr:ABC transporter permease subunit [Oscillospiraceae bacterium]
MMDFITKNKQNLKQGTQQPRLTYWVISAAVWLTVWQVLAGAVHEEILLVSPLCVFRRLCQLIFVGSFWLTIVSSMGRILLGFFLGMGIGTLLAVLTNQSRLCYAVFYPIISIINATPVASFIILALVWLSTAKVPVLTSCLIVMPSFWRNVSNGISETDSDLLEMAQVYRFGRRRTWMQVYIPSVLPYFSAACSTGIGMAWKAGVAAEVLADTHLSIGGNLYDAKIYLETPDLFAWTAAIVLLSILLEKGLVRLIQMPVKKLYAGEKRCQ